jgi:galactose mutarotase-like enzyme
MGITAALTAGPDFPQTPGAGGFAAMRFANRIQNGQNR